MKLINAHIENYGKLHAVDLNFEEGCSILIRGNGWGKSTLADFLVTMFYGFRNDRKRNVLENERKRYAPWQQGRYGGSVVFTYGERSYRLERLFGYRDAKEDLSSVYDAETGLLCEDFPHNPGEVLFGIDRESFEKSVYYSQQDREASITSVMQAKIGNLSHEHMDLSRYAEAQKLLKAESDRLTPFRKTGEIARRREAKAKLQHLLAEIPGLEQAEQKLSGEITDCRKELERLTAARAEMQNCLERAEGGHSIATFDSDGDRSAAGSVETELELDDLIDEWKERGRLQEQIRANRENEAMFRKMIRRKQEEATSAFRYENRKRSTERQDVYGRNANKVPGGFIAALGIVLLVTGCLVPLEFAVRATVAGAGILLLLISLIAIIRSGSAWQDDDPEDVDDRSDARAMDEADAMHDAFLELRERIRGDYERIEEIEAHINLFFEQRSLFIDEAEILDKLYEYRGLLRSDTRQNGPGQEELREIRTRAEKIRQMTEDIEHLSGRLTDLQSERRGLTERLDDLRDNQLLLLNEEEQLKKLEERYNIIEKTRNFLESSRSSFTMRYRDGIQKSFSNYYHMIAEDDIEYTIDAELRIKAVIGGVMRDPGYMSRGYRDLIGICYRMALVDAMYTEEKPFLILDDPFINLDDDKMEGAMEFLEKVSSGYQILYFTCQHGRA